MIFNSAKSIALLFIVVLMALASPVKAQDADFTPAQKQQLDTIIHDYLMAHPEVITQSVEMEQKREQEAEQKRLAEAAKSVAPITPEDHMRGNSDATVKLIEFTDLECPFCKEFHGVVKQAMDEYGKQGKLAWVYRHFPLDNLHSKARKEAQAAECAGELGGPEKFWAFADKVFEVTPSNDKLEPSQLPQIATELGIDKAKFETCLQGDEKGGKYAAKIQGHVEDAGKSGGTGTPYSILIGPGGKVIPINGAESYEALKADIETAMKGQ